MTEFDLTIKIKFNITFYKKRRKQIMAPDNKNVTDYK
jgi:hypothetical protein